MWNPQKERKNLLRRVKPLHSTLLPVVLFTVSIPRFGGVALVDAIMVTWVGVRKSDETFDSLLTSGAKRERARERERERALSFFLLPIQKEAVETKFIHHRPSTIDHRPSTIDHQPPLFSIQRLASTMTTPTTVNTPAPAPTSASDPTMSLAEQQQQPRRSATVALTVASLRRSSSHVTPTRTLVLSERERQKQAAAARVVSPLQIPHRPRSNQRTRTPRGGRYESPMDPAAFRRTSLQQQQQVENDNENIQPRLIGTVAVDGGTATTERRRDHHRPMVEQVVVVSMTWINIFEMC